jgi:hypothetical protein
MPPPSSYLLRSSKPSIDLVSNTSQNHLLNPLNLSSATYSPPLDANPCVLSISSKVSWYNANTRDQTPAGGVYISTFDLGSIWEPDPQLYPSVTCADTALDGGRLFHFGSVPRCRRPGKLLERQLKNGRVSWM